jgi:methionine-gamma-lyase
MRSYADDDISLTARTYTDHAKRHRPLSPPIVRATTFEAESAEHHRRLWVGQDPEFYQRFGHPTGAFVAERIARLERGEAALLFSAGMGAISASLLAVLAPGDHLVAHQRIFAQTRELIDAKLSRFGIECTFVDARDPAAVGGALRERTRAVYLESPCNPWLDVQDVAGVAAVLRAQGQNAELLVDSTFASPILQKPLELGATLVLHSATKYLGGHSDVLGGVAVGRAELIGRIREWQVLLGSVMDPEAAWRGTRSPTVRSPRKRSQAATAQAVAEALHGHPAIVRVAYPGLSDDPGHAVASRQMRAAGGVVAFELADTASARRFVDALRLIPTATSLGGVETVVELPFELDFDEAAAAGMALVRLSVGLEPEEELIPDLRRALDACRAP